MGNDHHLAKLMTAGGAVAAIGGAYKAAEFLFHAKKLRDVGPSNAVYVRLIARIRADLDEVRRLLTVREVHDALEANKEKAKWVYGAMRDVRGSLENIAPHTERVGGDVEKGKRVGIRHRVFWLLSEKEKLENREKELTVAHGSLLEVIGYLTGLEPETHQRVHDKLHHEEKHRHEGKREKERVDRKVDIDIDVRHEGPEERIDREVYVERDGPRSRRVITERGTIVEHDHVHRGPRRVEERYIDHDHQHRGPRRVEEHYVEHEHRGPGHYDERDVVLDSHGQPIRYDEREVFAAQDRQHHDRHGNPIEERSLHVERDPRDPRHVEARYSERGPNHYEEKRYEERRIPEPLGRHRAESYEDRQPERESWMQSDVRRPRGGEYAEYGAPQPVGAAHFNGLPPNREYEEREMWIEQKEDYRFDQYGNRLPDRFFPNTQGRSRL